MNPDSGFNQPHDALFRAAFSAPERAADLLRCILPADLAAAVDWSTLRPVDGTFVDADAASLHGPAVHREDERSADVLLRRPRAPVDRQSTHGADPCRVRHPHPAPARHRSSRRAVAAGRARRRAAWQG
ncbi:MAG: Rpn family recombination-promoting nuclease/putative transposase [Planctomycetes bacterium]|nr:Rpn family recombination-promoting nuclease/putative transposase [Planctomycetota bacterium]